MACCSRKCRGITLFFYGLVGVAVGILVGVVFLAHPKLSNFHAGIWGLVSFLFALADSVYGLLLWTAWKVLRKCVLVFFFIGCAGLSLGCSAFVAYLAFAIILTEDGADLVGTLYLVCVWCFMVFKWSMLLTFNSSLDHRAAAREKYELNGKKMGSLAGERDESPEWDEDTGDAKHLLP